MDVQCEQVDTEPPKCRGRPRLVLSQEDIERRRNQRVAKAKTYQSKLRADPDMRSVLYERVKACKKHYEEIYKLKNMETLRAYRRRNKEVRESNNSIETDK